VIEVEVDGPSAPLDGPVTSGGEAAELAARYGLARIDQNPSFSEYVRRLWRRRAFVVELAKARAYRRHQSNYLGQLWAVLDPLLLAGSYFLIFGLLLRTDRGVDNFIGFLTVGIFIYSFIAATTTSGAKSITGNQNLVRGVRFPRAALPVSVAMSEILTLLPALGVLLVILLLTGEPLTWKLALLPASVVVMFVFCIGVSLLAARAVASWRDAANFIPVGVRLMRYASGVMFSIAAYAGHGLVGTVMQYQPVAVYLELVRSSVLAETAMTPTLWAFAAGWAVVFLGAGIVLFWRAEHRYGGE
jgi:teichoic acid transport system permease protein